MNKNSKIEANEIRYREEDFGILMQSHYGGLHVVNESGIELLNSIKLSGEAEVDTLIKSYLEKFLFESPAEHAQAYQSCFEYLTALDKLKIIKVSE